MVQREWNNLRKNWWLKLVLLVIIFIPIIYTGIFLGSMWDPYGNSDQIPVAVVNQDKPVKYNGEILSAGKDTLDQLLENDNMDFRKATLSDANQGLKEGKYYMIIRIPQDFSKNATTLMDKNPKKMVIDYVMNPGKNYIASKMDESAILKIKDAVSSSVTQTYADTMFSSVNDLSRGLKDGSDAANKLHDGATKLSKGNDQLASGIVTLSESTGLLDDGATTLKDGVTQYTQGVGSLKNGADQLSQGINQLSSKSTSLVDGIGQLETGAKTLENGIKTYTAGVGSLKNGLSQLSENNAALNQGAADIATNVETLSKAAAQLKAATAGLPQNNPMFAQLTAAINGISDGLAALNTGATQFETSVGTYTAAVDKANTGAAALNQNSKNLVNGASSLSGGINQISQSLPTLTNGISQLKTGSNSLANGAAQLDSNSAALVNGANQLANGTSQLDQGAGKLQQGSSQLKDGFGKLTDGTSQLKEGLADGAEKSHMDTSEENVKMFASPVETRDTEISRVKNNGSAMAPYMMSVALYVAAMAFTLMYPLMNKIQRSKSGFRYWGGKASVMYPISTLAAIMMILLLMAVNGLDPVQRTNTFLFAILVSAAFMSMIVFFNAAFGRVGEFIMLIYMVVNLGGSAGTYPLETSAPWFKSIHPFVPFTYSVDGFRNVISMDDPSLMAGDVHVLLLMTISFAVATIIYYTYRRKNPEPLLKEAFPEE